MKFIMLTLKYQKEVKLCLIASLRRQESALLPLTIIVNFFKDQHLIVNDLKRSF